MKILKVETVLHLHRILNSVDALDEFGRIKNVNKTLRGKLDLHKLQFHCREIVRAFEALMDAPVKVEVEGVTATEPAPAEPQPGAPNA